MCGECGGSYGAKVWHSNDKYRKIVYRCNKKYDNDNKCSTPTLEKEDIENRFIKVVNELIQNKNEVIENLEMIKNSISNITKLETRKNELEQVLTEQVNKIQELIELNSRVVRNQDEYQKEYDELIQEYEIAKLEHQKIEHDISNKLAKKEAINQFIKTIKKQDKILTEFNKVLWGALLESATIKDKNTIIFKFKDGTEING